MPTSYAHKKFGALVYKALPADTKRLVATNYEYFLCGLHGPDVLFFHKPYTKSDIREIGHAVHKRPFKVFYDKAVKISAEEFDETKAYVIGCICHFILDSAVHPIVDEAIQGTGLSHGKLELELDRYALVKDGYTPIKYPTYAHIPVSKDVAEVGALFYKGVSTEQFMSSLITMKTAYAACGTGNKYARKLICKVMDVTGNSGKIASLIMSKDRSNMALDYVKSMYAKMIENVPDALLAIDEYVKALDGELVKNSRYKLNFSGKKLG